MTERARRRSDPAGAPERRDALLSAIGYGFRDPTLLAAALAHSSLRAAGEAIAFERLEFLGDRVLGLLVAELLLERFGREREGEIARRHAVLVGGDTLAGLARALGLGPALRLAPGQDGATTRGQSGVLADAFEALLAAIYLDGGLDPARALIHRLYGPLLETASVPPRDAKTALQEWAQSRALPLPAYQTRRVEGPAHRPAFAVEVAVAGRPPAEGHGASKRAAEQAAAAALLARLTAEERA